MDWILKWFYVNYGVRCSPMTHISSFAREYLWGSGSLPRASEPFPFQYFYSFLGLFVRRIPCPASTLVATFLVPSENVILINHNIIVWAGLFLVSHSPSCPLSPISALAPFSMTQTSSPFAHGCIPHWSLCQTSNFDGPNCAVMTLCGGFTGHNHRWIPKSE
jgi:hypothetical protein